MAFEVERRQISSIDSSWVILSLVALSERVCWWMLFSISAKALKTRHMYYNKIPTSYTKVTLLAYEFLLRAVSLDRKHIKPLVNSIGLRCQDRTGTEKIIFIKYPDIKICWIKCHMSTTEEVSCRTQLN